MNRTGSGALRVVLDARMPDGAYGGVQQWIIGVAEALSTLDGGGEEYLFLTLPGDDAWLRPFVRGACCIVESPPGASRSTWLGPARRRVAQVPGARAAWRAAKSVAARHRTVPGSDGTVERLEADVVHFPHQAGFVTTIPTLYQPWDLQHRHLPELFPRYERMRRDEAYRALCEAAATVITASTWVKRDIMAEYGIAAEKIAVVNVPPPTAAYEEPPPAEADQIRRRLGLPERFIYYPAQTWPHKNHHRLFQALGELRRSGLTVPLVCSGHSNEHERAAIRSAREAGVADSVKFMGFLTSREVVAVYRAADALVFPSLYEGWGLPIVEAFRAGLPVACSDTTSLPELVGDAAVVFDPHDVSAMADAVRAVWTDGALAARLAELGRQRANCFSWERVAATLRAHYRRVGGRRLDERDLTLLATEAIV